LKSVSHCLAIELAACRSLHLTLSDRSRADLYKNMHASCRHQYCRGASLYANVLTDHVLVQKVTSWTAVCSRRHQRSLLRASPVHGRPPVLPPQISAALARLYWIASVTRELSKARRASATPAFCWPEVHQTTRIGRSGCKNWRPNDNLVKAGKLSSRTGPTHQGFAFNQVCWSRELEAIERLRQSST
jgi:hypothetical protein